MSSSKRPVSTKKPVKKSTKQSAPEPESWQDKLLGNIKHFIATTPKQYLYIGAAVVVVLASVTTYAIVTPTRSKAKFCSTLTTGMDQIERRYEASSSEGSMTQMGVLMNNMSEFSKLLRDLNKVAPAEIEDDMKVVSEAWDKSVDDGTKNGANAVTNPLGALTGGLASGLASAIKNGASYNAVDNYAKEHCGRGLFSGTSATQNSVGSSDTEAAEDAITLDADGLADFKPWDGKQHGVVFRVDDKLVLVDTKSKKASAALTLPKERARTPGGDSGRSYTVHWSEDSWGSTPLNPFSPDFRYISASFDDPCQKDCGAPHPEPAYYDLKDKKINATGVAYKNYYSLDDWHMEDGARYPDSNDNSKIFAIYTKDIPAFTQNGLLHVADESNFFLGKGSESDRYARAMYYNPSTKELTHGERPCKPAYQSPCPDTIVDFRTGKSVAVLPKDGYYKYEGSKELMQGPCGSNVMVSGLLSDTKLLCGATTVVDISNVVNKKAEKDDPDDPEYVVGRLHYVLKKTTIAIDGETHSTDYKLSSDLKKIAIISRGDAGSTLYVADLSTGKATKIGVVKADDANTIKILGWR